MPAQHFRSLASQKQILHKGANEGFPSHPLVWLNSGFLVKYKPCKSAARPLLLIFFEPIFPTRLSKPLIFIGRNPLAFREYDIRGRVDSDFRPEKVERLGRALGAYYHGHGARRLVLARDCRPSSPEIAHHLEEALIQSGCQVFDIGVCPTPVLYFALRHLKADGGIMVTASHNPPEFNGLKICLGNHTIFGAEIQKVRRMVEAGDAVVGQGSRDSREMIPTYLDYLCQNLKIARPLRVGLDGGHGTAGPVALSFLKRMGCRTFPLYCEMDGRFPVHLPDPTIPANLADLQGLVKEHSLDLGVAYDGDGDRLGVVGPQGEIIWGDRLMVLFARDILKHHPGATIMGEVKCSQQMYEDIARHGGRPLMWKTGHSLIKQKMREEKALAAGEMSGHLFFADRYFGYDDAIYATGRLLEILAATDRGLPELLGDLPPSITTPEIRWDCPDERKFQIVENIKRRITGKYPFIDIDGIRLEFHDGWGLIRASNTQPALVLRFEAVTAERLKEIQELVEGLLQQEMGTGEEGP